MACGAVSWNPCCLSCAGMVIRPKSDETYEIVYDTRNTETWDLYAQALDKFLTRKSGSRHLVQWLKKLTAVDYPAI